MTKLFSNRREFLEFMGRASAIAAVSGGMGEFLAGCASAPKTTANVGLGNGKPRHLPFEALPVSYDDTLNLAKGLTYKKLIQWDDTINEAGDKFGFNNDYTAFIPMSENDGLLWVNHEYIDSYFISNYDPKKKKTQEQVDKERKTVGGSILRIKRKNINSPWNFVPGDRYNQRFDATTKIPFAAGEKIMGSEFATGTLANCAGGVTPWKTILTCEENFDIFYGEAVFDKKGRRKIDYTAAVHKWQDHYPLPPEHYGWVVEVNPFTNDAKKLTALGRFCHEAATTVQVPDGRTVVYMGDDTEDQCLYKFISRGKNSLEFGDLYVANMEKGQWILLDQTVQPVLKQNFKSQIDVCTYTRKAAALVGGTPLNRPEDIEIDPVTKAIFVTLTNNKPKGDMHGSILKIVEENNDHLSLNFQPTIFLTGGPEAGFSCPDNFVFDKKGNLWMTTDISETAIRSDTYKYHGNNSLFYIPMSGENAGVAIRVATGPIDCEFTGPSFDPEFKNLFLSVQHPGAGSRLAGKLTSHWPNGGNEIPRPAVITISGELLDKLMS